MVEKGKKGSGDTFDYTRGTTQELAQKWEKEKFHYTVNAVQMHQAHDTKGVTDKCGSFLKLCNSYKNFLQVNS